MRETLTDLYRHQEWADAELWRACETHPQALADPALWERLHHIHLVQRFFLAVARGDDLLRVKITKPDDYATPAALRAHAQTYHTEVMAFLDGADESALKRTVNIPWFNDPPLHLPVEQGLLQAALHSHYHRAQNVTRLRELGGVPPLTDYIVWLWKGKPEAQWT
jgi:uncharacterized damage-inducible protein DinB